MSNKKRYLSNKESGGVRQPAGALGRGGIGLWWPSAKTFDTNFTDFRQFNSY